MQRIYEWRNHIGNVAIEAIKKLWAADPKYQSSQERAAYVEDALSPALTFLYRDVEKLNEGTFAVSKLRVVHASCDTDPRPRNHCRSRSHSKGRLYSKLWPHTSRTSIQLKSLPTSLKTTWSPEGH